LSIFFLFPVTVTTETYTLSLHDALPISAAPQDGFVCADESCFGGIRRPHGHDFLHERPDLLFRRAPALAGATVLRHAGTVAPARDRKSTRLNSSHVASSYAVFCLKKKTR